MDEEKVRRDLLLKTALEILRDAGTSVPPSRVREEIPLRLKLSAREQSMDNSGLPRFERALGWVIRDAATVGWASKADGWGITNAGVDALRNYSDPQELRAELGRIYREIESLSPAHQFIATTLRLVEPGTWTAPEDIADLAQRPPGEVANFLASGIVQLPNAYRVLNVDGSVPAFGLLDRNYITSNLMSKLADEGINFDANGKASQDQRLSASDLRFLQYERAAGPDEETSPTAARAWMVRGTSVDGYNLVPQWLAEGFVSLSAAQLGAVDPDASYDELKEQVEGAYQHKSYAYRGQRLEEFDRFIRRMREGDLVLTPLRGMVYIGEVVSPVNFEKSASIDNLRRHVRWYDPEQGIDGGELHAPVPALLQSQAYVVDLTEAYDQIAALITRGDTEEPRSVQTIEIPKRTLGFSPVTAELAARLLIDQAELEKIRDLLWERKQVIFYGPPGTGKTYLATQLARHFTEDGAVKLVQFHPSYTYEDFFEGFRPSPGGDGTLTFTLRAGPFRDFAEVAQANPSTAYILIIDEINRANLAKVFGELYFLLEYRDESISLQYSPDKEFTLPQNLFLIGTMNTADRSIARIDAAMRRRFSFVELDPRIPPVRGLLARWLATHDLPNEPGFLLDLLNERLADADAAIGPSYLMKSSIYARADGLERVWRYEIMPLLEDLFYGQRDLAAHYGLDSLRKAMTRVHD